MNLQANMPEKTMNGSHKSLVTLIACRYGEVVIGGNRSERKLEAFSSRLNFVFFYYDVVCLPFFLKGGALVYFYI